MLPCQKLFVTLFAYCRNGMVFFSGTGEFKILKPCPPTKWLYLCFLSWTSKLKSSFFAAVIFLGPGRRNNFGFKFHFSECFYG